MTSAAEAGAVVAAPKIGLNPDGAGLAALLTATVGVIDAVDVGAADAGAA